jgi:ABC-type dipeptide/oligopeptide/nickel transport system ATPase component
MKKTIKTGYTSDIVIKSDLRRDDYSDRLYVRIEGCVIEHGSGNRFFRTIKSVYRPRIFKRNWRKRCEKAEREVIAYLQAELDDAYKISRFDDGLYEYLDEWEGR